MTLQFSRADLNDAKTLYDWRNDPLTRAQSHQTAELKWDEHLAWFTRSLQSANREIFFAIDPTANLKKVGILRRDRQSDLANDWILSWTVNPSERGKGYGSKMLADFVHAYPGRYLAEIKADNVASIKMTQAAGFFLKEESDEIQTWSWPKA